MYKLLGIQPSGAACVEPLIIIFHLSRISRRYQGNHKKARYWFGIQYDCL